MKNALMVLPPLEAKLLDPHAASDIAIALKALGVANLEIAPDPRKPVSATAHREYACPVPDFDTSVNTLIHLIFKPVLTAAGARDLGHVTRDRSSPDLKTLNTVGDTFARTAQAYNPKDGFDLGLVLHLALHGKTAARKPFDILVLPSMNREAPETLRIMGRDFVVSKMGEYGYAVDLSALRLAAKIQHTKGGAVTRPDAMKASPYMH